MTDSTQPPLIKRSTRPSVGLRASHVPFQLLCLLSVAVFAGVAAEASEDAASRIRRLDDLIARAPTGTATAHLLTQRAAAHRDAQRWTAAVADIERARAADPTRSTLDREQGRILIAAGRTHEGLVYLERYLTHDPANPNLWLDLARAYSSLSIHDRATSAYAQALRYDPRPGPELFLERSTAIAARGPDFQQAALDVLEAGIQRLGPAISLQLRALEFEIALQRFEAALGRVDALESRARTRAPWLLRRAEILHLANRAPEALRTLERARLDATSVPAHRQGSPAHAHLLEAIRTLEARFRAEAD